MLRFAGARGDLVRYLDGAIPGSRVMENHRPPAAIK